MNPSDDPGLRDAEFDPVAAYDRLAPYYSQFSERRSAYLRSVEEQISARIPVGQGSLLDIGAGDGSRAIRIAAKAGISRVVLLEPSAQMSVAADCEQWRLRIEELDTTAVPERFDVITCLWNVIGHVQTSERRARALKNSASLLSPQGLLFIDVIYRYNIRSYGWIMTTGRWLRDQFRPRDENGDVIARWQTAAGQIRAYGHVFTDHEIRRAAESAGLECMEQIVIDYQTGTVRKMSWLGNLLYVFRRRS